HSSGLPGITAQKIVNRFLRMALYNNQSTDGAKPDTPAKRASANSACRLRSVNILGDRSGSDGGKEWGTNARTDSPGFVEIE
ncbi:MAG TPA: hypothetical protein PK667_11720, partial [Nitrosomonas europaea]|uniref:hypothetical protein n=1 Tax=Nitrosomonas europaea TaxID=915 RepID=UPI00249029D7